MSSNFCVLLNLIFRSTLLRYSCLSQDDFQRLITRSLSARLPRWFRAEALKILEEQGVPIQISERFLAVNDSVSSLGVRLRELALAEDPRLSPLERGSLTRSLYELNARI